MKDDSPFRDAIREQPDEDVHRLAWADWLEENGQEARAALIRAQVQMARFEDQDDPRRDPFEDEADDLLAEHEKEWAAGVAEHVLDWEWSRGCIESVTLTDETLLTHGEELFRRAPIRRLRVLPQAEDPDPLSQCPQLRHVERLEIDAYPYGRTFFGVQGR